MLAWFRLRVQVSRPVQLTCIRLMSKRSDPFPLDNPIDYLNNFSRVPLLDEKNHLFKPSYEEVKKAQRFFRDTDGIRPWKGGIHVDQLPEAITPEVAFIGRSNVGKSSLIRSLFFNADFRIDISKTAGRTRTIQVYQVGQHLSLVDMPGYGENMPEYYATCVEDFLTQRKKLRRTFLLLDGTVGITEEDMIGLEMMEEFKVPYALVLTKADVLSAGEQLRHLYGIIQHMRNELKNTCFPQPFLVSSHSNAGMAFLRAFIAHTTNCDRVFKTTSRKRSIFT